MLAHSTLLTLDAAQMLVQEVVISTSNDCTAILPGLVMQTVSSVQLIKKVSARVVSILPTVSDIDAFPPLAQ